MLLKCILILGCYEVRDMKLPVDCRYAIEALAYIAINNSQKPVKLFDIAQAKNMSLAYLEKIFNKLGQHKIVVSIKGPGGGFKLNMVKENIQLDMIIAALDGDMQAMKCSGMSNCQQGERCLSHGLWHNFNLWVKLFFKNISLQQLIDKQHQPFGSFIANIKN